jgi:hypothetical protein
MQRSPYLLPIRLELHVDEIDDDQAADIAQSKLVNDFLYGLEVNLGDVVSSSVRCPT